jgi:hypothetical protein
MNTALEKLKVNLNDLIVTQQRYSVANNEQRTLAWKHLKKETSRNNFV